MLKNDYMEELENTLKLIRDELDNGLLTGDVEVARRMINKEIKALVGLDIEVLNTLNFSNVIEIVKKDNQYNAERYIALGELLYYEGLVRKRLDDYSGKINYYKKALDSFFAAYLEEKSIEDKYLVDVYELARDISYCDYNTDENIYIFKFYEINNQFDKAEDMLFHIIKDNNKDKNYIDMGIEFYNRLKEISEDRLEKGNLPINEVNDSLKELESMITNKEA